MNEDGNFYRITYADGHTTVIVEISMMEARNTAALTGSVVSCERIKPLW